MNQYRRNIKINQPDCFKPWQTQRNKSCSPLRNFKRPADMYRVAFAVNYNQGRTQSPNRNDPLHAVFASHLRRQLPNMRKHPQFNMMYKQRKDNQNFSIKQIYNNDIDRTNVERVIKHPKFRQNRRSNKKNAVCFEDTNSSNKFYSSSETDISSNLQSTACKNQSVRNVIDKFNRLSNDHKNFVSPKPTVQDIKGDSISTKPKINQRKEDIISLKIVNENRKEDNVKITYKNHKKSGHSPHKIESGIQLRSQTFKFTNNVYCDDLLEIFKPKDENEETAEKMSLMPRRSIVKFQEIESERNEKELVSSQTQTTPCPSATNIMINVYNNKTPRLVQEQNMMLNPIEIKISQDKDENTKLTISQENKMYEKKEIEITKKNVKSCIEKFEENLKKNGLETEKKISATKIFSKIRSNYLIKKECNTVLSPRAKSVPF